MRKKKVDFAKRFIVLALLLLTMPFAYTIFAGGEDLSAAIAAAESAIEELPEKIVLLEDVDKVEAARELVEAAFDLGASEADIGNLTGLLSAEEEAAALLAEVEENFYIVDSIFDLEPADNNRGGSFIDYQGSNWTVGEYDIEGQCFAPLAFFRTQYSNINPDSGHSIPWIEYDLGDRDYEMMRGYIGSPQPASAGDRPVIFSLYGDGDLIFQDVMSYGQPAVYYQVDITGIVILKIEMTAETDGWVNRTGVVEPQFLKFCPDKTVDAVEGAIDVLPAAADITLLDRGDVQGARRLLENAVYLGIQESDIANLSDLEAAEQAIEDLEQAGQLEDAIDDAIAAIAALPAEITLEDAADVAAARDLVETALAMGAEEEDIDNLNVLEAAEQTIAQLEAEQARAEALEAAEAAIAALPEEIKLLEHIDAVREARSLVEEALDLGVPRADIDGLSLLEAAEDEVAGIVGDMYDLYYISDSLFDLDIVDHSGSASSFVDYEGTRWSVGELDIDGVCVAPLAIFAVQYRNINPLSGHGIPWAEYDIRGLGYELMQSKTFSPQPASAGDRPVSFTVLGDDEVLYQTFMAYGEPPDNFAVEIYGKDTLRLEIASYYDDWVNRIRIVEPQFLKRCQEKAALSAWEAIDDLPDNITRRNRAAVEAARRMVTDAIYIGAAPDDIDNLDELEAAEAALADLPDVDYGDVNEDGVVNVEDVVLVMQYILGLTQLDPDQQNAADVNGDGIINVEDVVLVMQYVLSLIDNFPVED